MPPAHRSFLWAGLLAGFCALGMLVVPSESAGQVTRTANGTIKEIDLDKGTITLQIATKQETFSLASKDIKVVSTTGQSGKLTDLNVGAKVGLQLMELDVTSIRVEPEIVWGVVSAVDAKANTLAVRRGEAATKKLLVPADTKITLDGKAATFAAVKPGQRVHLTLSIDGKSVVLVYASGNVTSLKAAEALRVRPMQTSGILLDLDRDKNTMQVLIEYPGPLTIRQLDVEPNVSIRLQHGSKVLRENVPFKELAKLLKVHLTLDMDTKTVTGINAEYPFLSRNIVEVDLVKETLLIQAEMKQETWPLAKDAIVFQGSKEIKVKDMPKGRYASVVLDPERTKVVGVFYP